MHINQNKHFACILEQPEDNLGFKSRLLVFGGHVGGHIGFLGSPSFMPIYAGSFRNYRECGTFWYMTHLVVRGGPGSQFFSLESHPTIVART